MAATRKRTQFVVRPLAAEAELAACLELGRDYVTDHVWQVDLRDESDDLGIRFRTVRLPREMEAAYPRDQETLIRSWQARDCFLVAAADQVLLGYINLRVDAEGARGWIRDLVVGPSFRRRRIGSALLEQANRWAALHHLGHLTLEMQTKNYPAIQFARSHGFVFCGFDDRYYASRDIVLFFDRNVS